MSLDKDILGQALHNVRMQFNGQTVEQLVNAHGSLDNARLAMSKAEAEVIIDHIKTYGEGKYQAGSLTAGPTAVTSVLPIAIKIQ